MAQSPIVQSPGIRVAQTYVFGFTEGVTGTRRIGSAARVQPGRDGEAGLPVAAGVHDQGACRVYLATGSVPEGLDDAVAEHLAGAGLRAFTSYSEKDRAR